MSSKPITTNVKPQMLIKSTLYKTKKFCNKSLIHLQSFIPTNRYEKQPKNAPIFVMNSKLQELDDFYTTNSVEVVKERAGNVERKRDDQQCSSKSSNTSSDLKEERRKTRKHDESSLVAAGVLAQKMIDLEMMDLNDLDHVMDVEEVLHYYSRINCPAYVDIVDQFFMDMYSEFHALQPSGSLNNSMRKVGAQSLHTSMRTLGPLKL